MNKRTSIPVTASFGIAVFIFWMLAFPFDLMFQEQNQLFLFNWGFLSERLKVAGGLSMWISEFLVQFFLYPAAGAAIMAGLSVLIQILVWNLCPKEKSGLWYPLSFIPSILSILSFGDIYSMPCHTVALTITLLASCFVMRKRSGRMITLLTASALLYWVAGPISWIFIALALILDYRRTYLLLIPWNLFLMVLSFYTIMRQYPLQDVLCGVTYYRIPLKIQPYQLAAALSCIAVPTVCKLFHPGYRKSYLTASIGLSIAALSVLGVETAFQQETHTLVALDQLVRTQNWEKLLRVAEKRPVKSELYCVDVNLALFMTSRTDEAERFYQSGRSGLIMPRVRDFISNTSSYEVFWRLGMVNSCLRYAFDSQESLVNNQKSGRHMSRIAECHIVNGNYVIARKYLGILSKSLFYRKFAQSRIKMLETGAETDPVYSYLRQIRYDDDFLFYYPEMGKMLARLYFQNRNNQMAAYYYTRWESYSE